MKANLGCGEEIFEKYVNLDIVEQEEVDVVHDLNLTPYPFDDDSVEEVRMFHTLEHLDDIEAVMGELWRILKPDGLLRIEVPHFTSFHAMSHPQHKHEFHHDSFKMFTPDSKEPYTDRVWSVEHVEIRPQWMFSRLLKPLINLANVTRHWFTATPLREFLPQAHIYFELSPVGKRNGE